MDTDWRHALARRVLDVAVRPTERDLRELSEAFERTLPRHDGVVVLTVSVVGHGRTVEAFLWTIDQRVEPLVGRFDVTDGTPSGELRWGHRGGPLTREALDRAWRKGRLQDLADLIHISF
jgi:hypothetical protein